jgi:hypothetical protein
MGTLRSWATNYLHGAYPEGLEAPPVREWSLEQCRAFLYGQTRLHRFLVASDMAWSQLGTDNIEDQCTTISFRCARECAFSNQNPALWALLLGVALEVINPGHLLSAWQADLCRARLMLGI